MEPFDPPYTKTIKIEITWASSVEIFMMCLENGTATGKNAARAELRRMAQILDQLNEAQNGPTA